MKEIIEAYLNERIGEIVVANVFKSEINEAGESDESRLVIDENFVKLKSFEFTGQQLILNGNFPLNIEVGMIECYVDGTFDTLFVEGEYGSKGFYICKITDMPNYYE